MRKTEIEQLTCSVARTIGAVGERWTLLLLREFFLGTRRFEVLQAHTGISSRALSDRLQRLQKIDVITPIAYQQRPPRHEYRLTHRGLELYPIIVSMTRWGDRWMKAKGEPPPTRLVHKHCGHVFKPMLTCGACGEATGARDVWVKIGPKMKAERTKMRNKFLAAVSRKKTRPDLAERP
jgi:DNA-binding HxlR family transcriptional regulator